MNMIQVEFGLVPSVVKKESRAAYIESLAEARDTEDEGVFLRFMKEHHIQNIEEQIRDYIRSQNDTLNPENDTLNDTLNLTEKERMVLTLIRKDSGITIAQMMEAAGCSRPTVIRALRHLQERGLIRRVGAKKNGFWEIVT